MRFLLLSLVFIINTIVAAEQPCDYAINLMWIHGIKYATYQDGEINTNPYIYRLPNNDESDEGRNARTLFEADVASSVLGWAEKNPGAVVVFWYDGHFISPGALEATQSILCKENSNVKMRDIWELPLVKEHEDIFAPRTLVYFRTDLLRPIIQLHQIEIEKFQYSIYSDLDVGTMNRDEIFDEDTVQNLEKYGITFAAAAEAKTIFVMGGHENYFSVVSSNNRTMCQALRDAVVRRSIAKWKHHLSKMDRTADEVNAQYVFYCYGQAMLFYYNYLQGAWKIEPDDKFNFDPDSDTYIQSLVDIDDVSFVCVDERKELKRLPIKKTLRLLKAQSGSYAPEYD